MKKEIDLRTQVLAYLYKLPFYNDLPRSKKNKLYDEMMKVFAEDEFCKEHNINKEYNISKGESTITYCGQTIEFADKYGAENFISDMYELSMCCAGKY